MGPLSEWSDRSCIVLILSHLEKALRAGPGRNADLSSACQRQDRAR